MVFQDEYCEKCNEKYMNVIDKWCDPCQKKYLKMNFAKWTSGNEKIDNYIQEIQLKFGYTAMTFGSLFRWISYNDFYDIYVISKNDFNTLYSAIFELDSLYYNDNKKVLKKVILKCLHNSQYMIDEFLNEVT
jgi:hypothetical protein